MEQKPLSEQATEEVSGGDIVDSMLCLFGTHSWGADESKVNGNSPEIQIMRWRCEKCGKMK